MIRDRTAHYDVRISTDGLRRAAADNALLATTAKRNERLHGVMCWLAVIGLGMFLGWSGAGGLGS